GFGSAKKVVVRKPFRVADKSGPSKTRRDLLQHAEPLARDAVFVQQNARNIAARPRQTGYDASACGIRDLDKNDRNCTGCLLQCSGGRRRVHEDHVGILRHHFLGDLSKSIEVVVGKNRADMDVAAFQPAEFCKALPECRDAPFPFSGGLHAMYHNTNVPHPLRLLCGRRQRPRRCGAAEQRDEVAPSHYSITSSARASREGGTSTPSALAVWRLTIRSNAVGSWTGRLAGLAPFRICPA